MVLIESDPSSFGSVLKAFRLRAHLTQQQLASALGVHRRAIGRWESGDHLPASKSLVLELARLLRLSDQEARQLLEASLTALPPYFLVPLPRNPYFTGRETILEALHTQLSVDRTVALTQSSALHGLGGVGKTQIALEYAYRHALEYSAVFWIGAETQEQMISSLLRMVEVLHLPGQDGKDQQRLFAVVHDWLTSHSQWLLILDNVEDLTLLDRFLPTTRSGSILLTTRSSTLGTGARGLDLAPMESEEGLLFLLRRAKLLAPDAGSQQVYQFAAEHSASYAAATALVEALGGLPLALDQAGAYLEATHCGLLAYLDLFHSRRLDLLSSRGEGVREHPASVATTFALALTSAASRSPAVRDLLHLCALLQPDAIPEALFRQGAVSFGPTLQTVCRDPLEWNRLLAEACSSSLLSRQSEEQSLSLHRLVQAVLLDTMTQREQEHWGRQVIAALDTVFPDVLQTREPALWKQGERFLPHALVCLSRREADEDVLALASLASKVTAYLRMHGRYAEAERIGQRALDLRERAVGLEHPDVAFALNALAIACWKQGKYAQAELLYLRALRLWEQTHGSEHPDVAHALNNLANVLGEQGDYPKAELLYLRALDLRERTLGPGHALVGTTLNNLARLYCWQGRYREAEPLYLRALSVEEQALGKDHPDVAHPLNGLATVYSALGHEEQAELLYQRALSLREQHLGALHPETGQTLHDLALLRRQQGKLSEAHALAQQALRIRSQSLGSTHPQTLQTQTLCAQMLEEHLPQAGYPSSPDTDPFQRFLTECCELHPRAWCRSADLWLAYQCWVQEHQERYPLSRASFTQRLKAAGCRANRTNTARIWRGVTLANRKP